MRQKHVYPRPSVGAARPVDDEYDVLIVGARVAGSTLATLLGEAGQRVLLIDRATFPSPTLSTHFFRGGRALEVFDRLGVLDQVLALGSPKLVCDYRHKCSLPDPVVELAQESGRLGYNLSVRREPLDHLLVQRARSLPTVDVLERTSATSLLRDWGRVVGARLMTPQGPRTVRARIVVGADGRHSWIARAVEPPYEASDPGRRAAYYCYVRGMTGPGGHAPDGAEFSRIEDEMAYVFPSDGGLSCIALSVNRDGFDGLRRAGMAEFRRHIARHRGIAERFMAATPVTRMLGTSTGPTYVRVPYGPGWALVGDAGLHADPVAGTGIDMATTHAAALADALVDWLRGTISEEVALERYHWQRNNPGLEIYHQVTARARDLRAAAVAVH
jgi:2-polyprenyl-6-methoxyphenol hydroxylase-like FAD-dependent oxidoreductase